MIDTQLNSQRLLLQRSVTEACYESGFANIAYFNKTFNPRYAIENLLRAEIAANTAISSYFLFTVGMATLSKKILAGISVVIALSTLVTIPIT